MRNLVILLFVFSSYVLFGQDKNNGYLGKTNFVEATTVSYIPMMYNFLGSYGSTGYKSTNGSTLTSKSRTWFNTGFRVSVGRAFKRNFGMSIETGMDFYEEVIPDDYFYNIIPTQNEEIRIRRHENLDIRVLHIMPKFHIANRGSLLPLGLSHEIGIGYAMTSIADKDYVAEFYIYDYTNGNQNIPAPDPGDYLNYERRYRSLQLLYGIKMRTPVSKSLFINYGFRYTIEFGLGDNWPQGNANVPNDLTSSILSDDYNRRLLYNVASFDLGVSFVF